mgnify:CR=1 FL=1
MYYVLQAAKNTNCDILVFIEEADESSHDDLQICVTPADKDYEYDRLVSLEARFLALVVAV